MAESYGNAIYSYNLDMSNCIIINNEPLDGSRGSGISCFSSQITNCLISGNYGTSIRAVNSEISNCIITGPRQQSGWFNIPIFGGISSANSHITNCTITGHSGLDNGGIFCSDEPDLPSTTIINCVISGNRAVSSAGYSGGIVCLNSSPIIINSIIWGNTATDLSTKEIYLYGTSTANISYSDIDQDGFAGTNGNIRMDPL